MMRRKQAEDEAARVAAQAAASGGISGAVLGGVGKMLSGQRALPSIIKAALTGAGAGAGIAGGSTYLGTKIMGTPSSDDPGAYTNRGLVGGLLGGGAAGAGLGYLAGSGKLKWLMQKPLGALMTEKAGGLPVMDNLIADYVKGLAGKPSASSAMKGGALLGGLGGAVGGYMGSDEGMQLDYMQQMKKELAKRRYMEALSGDL